MSHAPRRDPTDELIAGLEVVHEIREVVFRLDRRGRWTFLNRAWTDLTGQSVLGALGRPAAESFDPSEEPLLVSICEQLLAGTRASAHLCFALRHADGTSRWVDAWARPIRDDSGAVLGLAGSLRDVTREREVEAQVRRRDAILEAVGYASREWLATTDWKAALPPALERLSRAAGACRATVVHGEARIGCWARSGLVVSTPPMLPEWHRRLDAGETVHAHAADLDGDARMAMETNGAQSALMIPIFAAGERWGCIVFEACAKPLAWDVPAQRALRIAAALIGSALEGDEAATIQKEAEQLRAMDEARKHFINATAHEINTPLTPLMLHLSMLGSKRLGPLTDRQQNTIHVLERNLQRLASLVGDMLDIGRAQHGTLRIKRERVEVSEVVQDTLRSFQLQSLESGVDVHGLVPPGLVLDADPGRLQQVLTNLVSNALKWTPRGGQVRVYGDRDGEAIRIQVQDTGAGFEPRKAKRLFKPFSRIHDDGVPGTGLGLHICQGIVEAHGGSIECSSEGPGKGATFTVTLPRHKRVAPPATTPAAESTTA